MITSRKTAAELTTSTVMRLFSASALPSEEYVFPYKIIVDIGGFKWMIETSDFVAEGSHIGLYIEPDAIHIMKKSEYSGLYGDYSSFSDELEELSDADSVEEE